jgi:hypothetical protein
MAKEPRRFRGAYGAAQAAEAAGDRGKARKHFQSMLEIAGGADSALPELEHAREYVAVYR